MDNLKTIRNELPNKETRLTPKQKAFVDSYLVDLNATQAAIRAGYSEKTAAVIGNQLLNKPAVMDKVNEIIRANSVLAKVTTETIIQFWEDVRNANIMDYVEIIEVPKANGKGMIKKAIPFNTADIGRDKMRLVAGIKNTKHGIEIVLHSKDKANEMLARYKKLFGEGDTKNLNQYNITFNL